MEVRDWVYLPFYLETMSEENAKARKDIDRRVTVRDIASEIGIHFTTVAEALRDSPRVKEATKKKVRAAADRMGYRADPMLSALAAYRTQSRKPSSQGTLMWINGFGEREFFSKTYGFYSDCYRGAQRRSRELGYRLETFWMSEPGMTSSRASQELESRRASGVIVGPMPHGVDALDLFWDDFCSVRIGYSLRNPELTTVTADQFANARLLFDKLRNSGSRRIGFACPELLDRRTNHLWTGGYLAAQQDQLESERLDPFIDFDPNDNKAAFLEWFKKQQPDALIAGGGLRYYDMLREAGVKIPEQLSFVSLHADTFKQDLAGIMQNGENVGIVSVDHLVAVIHRFKVGLETHPKVVTISGQWKDGKTFSEPNSSQ